MKCPSCGFEQTEDRTDCECCGLIFAKWRERHAPPPPQDAPAASPGPENGGTEGEVPPPSTESSGGPEESAIPDRPEEEHLLYNQRRRVYEQIAALDFQKNTAGNWLYFPWGLFGPGYQLKNEETKEQIERFLTLFCSLHSPLVALLGLLTFLTWHYNAAASFEGWIFLVCYLSLSYAFLWVKTTSWTSRLKRSSRRMNAKQYAYLFLRIFHWRTLLDLEVVSLVLILACLWFWFSENWRWFIATENESILWMTLTFLGSLLTLFTHLYYFRKK